MWWSRFWKKSIYPRCDMMELVDEILTLEIIRSNLMTMRKNIGVRIQDLDPEMVPATIFHPSSINFNSLMC